ncbi:histidine kinase [Salinimonas marina]|uniref:Histidine kinase n=1 Tax=Salinimonas marina TaxID=2785918 RepID=A0A7S9DXF4_9ALTE|nr:histidine kinase [Salinimonas marina]QPG05756.1 histidine kinase [Salinimonas marina]
MNSTVLPAGFLTRYCAQIGNTSKLYRALMLLIFGLHFILTWAAMQSLLPGVGQYANALVTRALLEAVLFTGICHFLVRPYLRLNLVGITLAPTPIALGLLYLMLLSVIYFCASFAMGKLQFLNATDLSQLQVLAQQGQPGAEVSLLAMIVMGSAESFVTLSLWAFVYLGWHFQKNKRSLQRQVNQSQIQQLTNQLSPHFLFNSLNSIRALIFADQERAAEVLTLLSDLLRTQMQAQMKTRSTLQQEWQLTKKYLEIEKVRFDERLMLDIQLDDQTLHQEIPTLTLLTLAENAIKHGISQSSQPGFIRMHSYITKEHTWCLEVVNSHFSQARAPGTRVGQHNVKKRLELLYGNRSQFITREENQQYQVWMELPYVKSLNR